MTGLRNVVVVLATLVFVGCSSGSGDGASSSSSSLESTTTTTRRDVASLCERQVPDVAARVNEPQLPEVSGIAASRRDPGVVWMHNDSGDTARVFAVGGDGVLRAVFTLEGAEAVDWEDMAIGPAAGAEGDFLYVGDIGDNLKARDDVTIYRFPEPDVAAAEAAGGEAIVPAAQIARIDAVYPDAPHDAETLLVDPRDASVHIVVKRSRGFSEVYEVPMPEGAAPAEPVTMLAEGRVELDPLEMLTGGDVAPQGDAIALRSYGTVRIYEIAPDQTIGEALAGESCSATSPPEPQGEAIAFTPDGTAYLTITESRGRLARLFRVGG